MISLGDPRSSNPVLSTLQIKSHDRIISIKENPNSDANFIITHLIKQILFEKNNVCLVALHNSLEHYQIIGKKLGYDLGNSMQNGSVKIIELLYDIVENIGSDVNYLQEDKEDILKFLFNTIKAKVMDLSASDHSTYLIFDDLSHLLDLGVETSMIGNFINYCINLVDDNTAMIVNTHVSTKSDEIISNNLQYLSDVHIEISSLATGKSTDVTGTMTVCKKGSKSNYQFKAYDRGIKTFHPGESIYHLYK